MLWSKLRLFEDLSQRPWKFFAGKTSWHFIGLSIQVSYLLVFYFADDSLYDCFPIYEEMMVLLGFKKEIEKLPFINCSILDNCYRTAMTPINRVFSVTAMALHKTATGITISNAQYMMIGIPAGFVLLSWWECFYDSFGEWIYPKWNETNDFARKFTKKVDARKQRSLFFMGVVLLWVLQSSLVGYYQTWLPS